MTLFGQSSRNDW